MKWLPARPANTTDILRRGARLQMVDDLREREPVTAQGEDGMEVIGHHHQGIEQDVGVAMRDLVTEVAKQCSGRESASSRRKRLSQAVANDPGCRGSQSRSRWWCSRSRTSVDDGVWDRRTWQQYCTERSVGSPLGAIPTMSLLLIPGGSGADGSGCLAVARSALAMCGLPSARYGTIVLLVGIGVRHLSQPFRIYVPWRCGPVARTLGTMV
jgi:hypothetical protein